MDCPSAQLRADGRFFCKNSVKIFKNTIDKIGDKV